MKIFTMAIVFVLGAALHAEGTIIGLSGVLGSGEAVVSRGPGEGTFNLRLSGTTLDYAVHTTQVSTHFDAPESSITLQLPSGDVELPFTNHISVHSTACDPHFIYTPLSWRYAGSTLVAIPLDIPPPLTQCDATHNISILSGSVNLDALQLHEFELADFLVEFHVIPDPQFGSPFMHAGRTDPNVRVIPEPSCAFLLLLGGAAILLRRRQATTAEQETG